MEKLGLNFGKVLEHQIWKNGKFSTYLQQFETNSDRNNMFFGKMHKKWVQKEHDVFLMKNIQNSSNERFRFLSDCAQVLGEKYATLGTRTRQFHLLISKHTDLLCKHFKSWARASSKKYDCD